MLDTIQGPEVAQPSVAFRNRDSKNFNSRRLDRELLPGLTEKVRLDRWGFQVRKREDRQLIEAVRGKKGKKGSNNKRVGSK